MKCPKHYDGWGDKKAHCICSLESEVESKEDKR